MSEVVETASIRQPVSAVWVVLADFEAISRWAPNVDHSSLTTSAAGDVGATRRIQTGRTTVLETVTRWEPEQVLAYSISGLPPVIRSVTNTWRLAEAAGGATEVTLTSAIDTGPRPPQKLVGRAVGRALAKASRQMLDGGAGVGLARVPYDKLESHWKRVRKHLSEVIVEVVCSATMHSA